MPVADFEEKEFEVPLYRELLASEFDLWTPGQVLEGHLGFDGALRVAADYWDIVGRQQAPGVTLARYGLSPILARPGSLPDFSTNLFLQVKRPFEYTQPPDEVTEVGLSAPCWSFETREHQQLILERLAEHLGNQAEVAYASPAFAQKQRLFALMRERVLRWHTTFPPAGCLKGHSRWAYAGGGTDGVGYSDPERITVPSLAERLERIRPGAIGPFSERWAEREVHELALAIPADREEWITQKLHGLAAAFDDLLAVVGDDGRAIGIESDDAVRQVGGGRRDCQRLALRIALITSRIGIMWLAIGPRSSEQRA